MPGPQESWPLFLSLMVNKEASSQRETAVVASEFTAPWPDQKFFLAIQRRFLWQKGKLIEPDRLPILVLFLGLSSVCRQRLERRISLYKEHMFREGSCCDLQAPTNAGLHFSNGERTFPLLLLSIETVKCKTRQCKDADPHRTGRNR